MSLLELDGVSRSYRQGARVAVQDVSLSIEPGELVVVWGERRSGRSTLLRLAAGIEQPDSGTVRFEGRDIAAGGPSVPGGLGYCRKAFRASSGRSVIDHLLAGQLARRTPRGVAVNEGWKALARVGAESCAGLRAGELSADETVRVSIARALTAHPRLLVIDEPTIGVDLRHRDGILRLLRSLADEGVAVLSSAGEGTGLLGADRALSIGKGRLRGELKPELAPVTDLGRRRRSGS